MYILNLKWNLSTRAAYLGHITRPFREVDYFWRFFFYCSYRFHSIMVVVVESCVAIWSPFVQRFDFIALDVSQ